MATDSRNRSGNSNNISNAYFTADGRLSEVSSLDRLRILASSRWQRVVNLGVMALSELLGGFTFSLLSPFYTQEATDKGMTVAETGLVRRSI